jgi:hypothetical protein
MDIGGDADPGHIIGAAMQWVAIPRSFGPVQGGADSDVDGVAPSRR